MKQINHQHAKQTKKLSIGRIILYIIGAFIGLDIVGIIFIKLTQIPVVGDILTIVFLLAILYGVYVLFKKFKQKVINPIAGNFTSQTQSQTPNRTDFELNKAVQITNPYSGVFICGGAGSGKSKSIIEPIIYDAGRKNFTGVIYDFKFPELARHVETAYQNSPVNRYYVNFSDLNTTNRINPIAPEIMRNASFAREFASSVLQNINPQSISKPDFWSDNSQTLLSAVFWYLREEQPRCCTLPHAISLITQGDTPALIKLLQTNYQCADMVAPIATAIQSGAGNQLAGVVSSLQVSLNKINTPEVYYVTGQGNDFNLNLNDPDAPSILTIGNDPVLATTYGPVIGLMLTAISKQLNQQGRDKSLILIDEFPTIFVPNIETIPATARSNKVATVLACQDITQIVDKYGREKADTVLSNLGNQFYGRTTNPQTAQRVSQLFGKSDKLMQSDNTNYNRTLLGNRRSGSGESFSYQEREIVKVQEVATLETGSFYAILSEGAVRMGKTSIPLNRAFIPSDLPQKRNVTDFDVKEVYHRIKRDIEGLISGVQ